MKESLKKSKSKCNWCLWGVTQLFGYKNVLLKNIGISTLVEFGWSLGGVVYAKESV